MRKKRAFESFATKIPVAADLITTGTMPGKN
jgi:hypothetical protein